MHSFDNIWARQFHHCGLTAFSIRETLDAFVDPNSQFIKNFGHHSGSSVARYWRHCYAESLLVANCLTISIAIQSLTRAEITISNASVCFVPVAQASSPAGFSFNKSRFYANCENPLEEFRATFDFDTQYTLSIRGVNIVAIEAMYRLSLQS